MGLVVPNFDSSRELLVICVTPGIANNPDWEIHGKIVPFGSIRGFPLKPARDRAEPFESGFPRRLDLPPSSIGETARIIFACAAKKGSVLDVRQGSIDSAAADSHPRAQGKVCSRGTLLAHRSYVVRFAHAAGDEFSAALVLLRWQSALALDAGHYRSGDRPFLRAHLCDAGLAGAANRTRPSVSLFFLGVWTVHRELWWNALHGGNNCLEARLLALRRREDCHRFRLRRHRRRSAYLRGRYRRFRANRARGRRAPGK